TARAMKTRARAVHRKAPRMATQGHGPVLDLGPILPRSAATPGTRAPCRRAGARSAWMSPDERALAGAIAGAGAARGTDARPGERPAGRERQRRHADDRCGQPLRHARHVCHLVEIPASNCSRRRRTRLLDLGGPAQAQLPRVAQGPIATRTAAPYSESAEDVRLMPKHRARPIIIAVLVLACATWSVPGAWAGAPTDQLRGGIDRVFKILRDPEMAGD